MANVSYNIDFAFVESSEGGSQLEAYVPMCSEKSVKNKKNKICFGQEIGTVIGKSGVTIGTGFDLGQNNFHDLQQLNLPPELHIKLIPYLLKQKKSAVTYLNEHPLLISEQDAEIINQRKKEAHAKQLQKKYDHESKVLFEDLPYEIQTVLFSITYQYGLGAVKSSLRLFWKASITQDYEAMIKILLNFGVYQSRRRAEADMVKKMQNRLKSKPNWIIDESFISYGCA
jgi:hypothetical protein